MALWRLHPDHLRVSDHCPRTVHHHQGHQPAQPAAPPSATAPAIPPTRTEQLLEEIRDQLAKR